MLNRHQLLSWLIRPGLMRQLEWPDPNEGRAFLRPHPGMALGHDKLNLLKLKLPKVSPGLHLPTLEAAQQPSSH